MPSALNMYTNDLLFYVTLCVVFFFVSIETRTEIVSGEKETNFRSLFLWTASAANKITIEIEINTKPRPEYSLDIGYE